MRVRYEFPRGKASVHAARRSTSIWRSHGKIWFQLAGIRDATLCGTSTGTIPLMSGSRLPVPRNL
jgi:hypothetical protein